MIELAILGLLKERAMHGYELSTQLNHRAGLARFSWGSLYPALKRLDTRGLVEKIFPEDETRRRKNVYRITEAGEREFFELIVGRAQGASDEDKFPLRLAFFGYLRPEIRLRLLDRRQAYLHQKLEDLTRTMREAREHIDSYSLSLLQHNVDGTQADIAWLDDLIAAERRQLAEGGEDGVPARVDETTRDGDPSRRTSPGKRAPARSRP